MAQPNKTSSTEIEAEAFEYDVFISYSSKDKEWVRGELLERLEAGGLKVCIDFRDFKVGRNSLLNMQDGARHSRRLVPVLTENWFASEWTFFEGLMAGRKGPAGLNQRIVPLLRRRCDYPDDADFIAALTHVDFTEDTDMKLAWRQLLTALGAPPESPQVQEPKRDNWFLAHPYAMPPNFTGRAEEKAMLSRWLTQDAVHPLLVVRALGGFGKSALAWHWLMHDVKPKDWPRVVWWSFYENDSSFRSFLASALDYLSGGKVDEEKLRGKQAVIALLKMLYSPGALLVLDGFERELREFSGMDAAYKGDEVNEEISNRPLVEEASRAAEARREPRPTRAQTAERENERDCVSPVAEAFLRAVATLPEIRAKILMTTRLRPTAVETRDGLMEGCLEEELNQMRPADAVAFFHARGIRGGRSEIEAACEPYGYHPLSLGLLAGWIAKDLQQPGDILAAKRFDLSGKDGEGLPHQRQRQHHVLEQAYESLTDERKQVLGRIACFRGPVKYEALVALSMGRSLRKEAQTSGESGNQRLLTSSPTELEEDLRDLVARGLLHRDLKTHRFDLHPIVRRYAYDRLTAPDRAAAHAQLRDYFEAVPMTEKVPTLEELAPVIELYHHTVRAGQYDEAFTLFYNRINEATYYQFGAYQLRIDLLLALFPNGEERPPRLKDESHQSWTLSSLANSYSTSGQPRRAVPLVGQCFEKERDKGNRAIFLGNLAQMQMSIGSFRAVEMNLRQSIALCREVKDAFREPMSRQILGRLLVYRGEWGESEAELATALKMSEKRKSSEWQGKCWAYRTLRELLLLRSGSNAAAPGIRKTSPIKSAQRALELADEWAKTQYPLERDYVRAHWLLGAALRVAGELEESERHLNEALERCRRINLVDHEADILIDLARLRMVTNAPEEARRWAEEAVVIAERSGYVMQGADAHLELAKLDLAREDNAGALRHAEEARRLATCDGPPDYTYKVAYDEAGELLARLKQGGK